MSVKADIEFRLNGVVQRVTVEAHQTTLELLRDGLGLTGTKYGCGEGECGACTIQVDGDTVNACLMFAVDCDGRDLLTIEGLSGSEAGDRLCRSMVEYGAVQCGFCTPGIMVQAQHVLEKAPHAGASEIRRGLEGNLCRCTGYKKIIEAIEAASNAAPQR